MAAFPLLVEDPVVHAINRRLAAVVRTDVSQGEPLQVLRYKQEQEYRSHVDALPEADNQRLWTVLVYLNEDYEGGETAFLATNTSIKGSTGDAVAFRNADAQGRPDPLSQHAGLPVTQGVKLLASRWIRARPLSLDGPRLR